MALPDFSKFKAPYRFVPEGKAFRLYEKGVKTNTTFKTMADAKKKVLALNDAWRASPAGRKATPKKKYDKQGHVVRKPAPRARANPFFGMFVPKSKQTYEVSTNGDYPDHKRTFTVSEADLYGVLTDLGLREDYATTAAEQAKTQGFGKARTRGGYGELIEVRRLAANPDKYGFDVHPQYGEDPYIRALQEDEDKTLRRLLMSSVAWKRQLGEQVRDGVISPESVESILHPGTARARRKKKVRNPRRVGMFSTIQPGDRVTIVTPRGQEMTGRAVMKGPAGWLLNVGGRYGTPALADEDNVVKVSKSRRAV
jgi:hypothetical protein